MTVRINIGAGNEIISGYVNHDIAKLPGIDVVHNLNEYPWPWGDSSVEEIIILDVLEHLDNFMLAIEEIHRILAPGGRCYISVPYWNSWCVAADPTHKRGFHEVTFQFFDPDSVYCQERPYYSEARFKIIDERFIIAPFGPYFSIPKMGEVTIKSQWGKRLIGFFGNYIISNLIHDLRLTLKKI